MFFMQMENSCKLKSEFKFQNYGKNVQINQTGESDQEGVCF